RGGQPAGVGVGEHREGVQGGGLEDLVDAGAAEHLNAQAADDQVVAPAAYHLALGGKALQQVVTGPAERDRRDGRVVDENVVAPCAVEDDLAHVRAVDQAKWAEAGRGYKEQVVGDGDPHEVGLWGALKEQDVPVQDRRDRRNVPVFQVLQAGAEGRVVVA